MKSIEQQVIQLVESVAQFIRIESVRFDPSRIEKKDLSAANLVSYVDREAEKRLTDGLLKILPQSGCLAEEGTVLQTSTGYQWIIDPLDGTTNFVHGFPTFSTSVGLVYENELQLGVVYDIMQKNCYHASEKEGAYCNGKEIRVSSISELNMSLLATGFPYLHSEKKEVHLNIIRELLNTSHGIRRLGSAALDLAYVATGQFEGFFEYDLNPWDVAGGAFIVQKAGGMVTDFSGGVNFLFGRELCAAGAVHPNLLRIIDRYWNDLEK